MQALGETIGSSQAPGDRLTVGSVKTNVRERIRSEKLKAQHTAGLAYEPPDSNLPSLARLTCSRLDTSKQLLASQVSLKAS